MDLIDDVIDEPLIGAHRNKEGAADAIADYFLSSIAELGKLSDDERMDKRYNRLTSIGAYEE